MIADVAGFGALLLQGPVLALCAGSLLCVAGMAVVGWRNRQREAARARVLEAWEQAAADRVRVPGQRDGERGRLP